MTLCKKEGGDWVKSNKISLKEHFCRDLIGVWKITLLSKDPVEKNKLYHNVANGKCYEKETKRNFGNTFWGRKLHHNMGVFGIFSKYQKNAHFVRLFPPLRMRLQILFMCSSCSKFNWLCCGILPFFCRWSWGEVCETKWPVWSIFVLVKYYGIQWLLEEKIFLKKPTLLAVSFKFMTYIDLFVIQFILNLWW